MILTPQKQKVMDTNQKFADTGHLKKAKLKSGFHFTSDFYDIMLQKKKLVYVKGF